MFKLVTYGIEAVNLMFCVELWDGILKPQMTEPSYLTKTFQFPFYPSLGNIFYAILGDFNLDPGNEGMSTSICTIFFMYTLSKKFNMFHSAVG